MLVVLQKEPWNQKSPVTRAQHSLSREPNTLSKKPNTLSRELFQKSQMSNQGLVCDTTLCMLVVLQKEPYNQKNPVKVPCILLKEPNILSKRPTKPYQKSPIKRAHSKEPHNQKSPVKRALYSVKKSQYSDKRALSKCWIKRVLKKPNTVPKEPYFLAESPISPLCSLSRAFENWDGKFSRKNWDENFVCREPYIPYPLFRGTTQNK